MNVGSLWLLHRTQILLPIMMILSFFLTTCLFVLLTSPLSTKSLLPHHPILWSFLLFNTFLLAPPFSLVPPSLTGVSPILCYTLKIVSIYLPLHTMISFRLYIPLLPPAMAVSFALTPFFPRTTGGRVCRLSSVASLLVAPSANR